MKSSPARSICQISPLIPPSKDGVGDSTKKYHDMLLRKGIDSAVITSSDQRKEEHVYPCVRRWNAAAVVSVVRTLRRLKTSDAVLHYPSARFGRSFWIIALPLFIRIAGIRVSVYLHEYAAYSIVGKCRALLLSAFAHSIITTDTVNLRHLRGIMPWKHIEMLPCGSTFSLPSTDGAAAGKSPAENGKKNVFFFGFIRHGKGLEQIINACEMDRQLAELCTFHFVGGVSDTPSAQDADLMSRIGRLPNAVVHGFVGLDDLVQLLSSADLFVQPYENGLTERRGSFMNLMMLGKPVLTSRPPFPLRGLREGENILYLADDSVQSIIGGITDFFMMPDERRKSIGLCAAQWFRDNFSDEATIRKLMDILSVTP